MLTKKRLSVFNRKSFNLYNLVPRAGLEPAQAYCPKDFKSFASTIPPPRHTIGGDTRNRTGDQGFADPCLTTWLCRQKYFSNYDNKPDFFIFSKSSSALIIVTPSGSSSSAKGSFSSVKYSILAGP